MVGYMDVRMYRWMYGWIDEWMGGWIHRLMDGWTVG
jgi:hypothetical protein